MFIYEVEVLKLRYKTIIINEIGKSNTFGQKADVRGRPNPYNIINDSRSMRKFVCPR